ncbi:hypothetical protein LTR08_000764 [Meristemomyces frigidus]|nr:hypothetical protein LTR08_000764 [Meristemomyces frigidus]
MSFGFGSNNNNNTGSSGFGGFGSSNPSGGGGFGTSANTNTTSAGSLFGGNTATAGGGFGGFGAAANTGAGSSPFGAAKPAFGAPAATTSGGGGLFGGNTTSTTGAFGGGGGGGGFGATANTGTGFGSNTGGGLFGSQPKPAATGFGAAATGNSLFGGGSTGNTSTGFGGNANATPSNPFSSGATSTGFGATNTSTHTNTGGGFGAANTSGGGFGGFGATSTAGGNNNNGTAALPFQAITEKEAQSNATVSYQSVTFQEPYKNKSFEELRVEDYAQGRRFGNTNGQAGSFGQSTGFGGFGQTNTSTAGGGLFGSQQGQQNTAASGSTFGGFGNNANTNTTTPAANPFGANTGGMFGAQKPAAAGLFGAPATGASTGGFGSTASGTGGLFGNQQNNQPQTNAFGGAAAPTTGGGLFGSQPNNQQASNAFGGTSTTGGLFGGQNPQQQPKPAFGGFGQTGSTGGGMFGGQNNNQQQQQSNAFGGTAANTGGGIFGNQNKPVGGGLFGAPAANTTTGGGMFGSLNQGNTGASLFGGQNQNKATGTGLFGGSTNTGTTGGGGGLFGGNTGQQSTTGSNLFGGGSNTGNSLFGGNNQSKPATASLFGNAGASNTGSSLFGGNQQNQNQNTGNSIFAGSQPSMFASSQQNQQNNASSLFGGMNSQQQQQPNQLHASITGAPYGNEQLFSSLAAPSPPVGPLATPLAGARPQQKKTPSLMASMRANTPVYTPRATGSRSRTGGYGFTYSTYGTPTSAFSGSLTPGASSMLRPTGSFGSALTSKLNKSISMGNLLGGGTPGEGRPSLLRESALSPPGSSASRYGSGSVRKLNIDRSLRTELFAPSRTEESSRSRVTFDRTAEQPEEMRRQREPQARPDNALVRTEEESEPESPVLLRSDARPNGVAKPEMTQVNASNGALSSVPEDGVAQRPGSAPATQQRPASSRTGDIGEQGNQELGEYWTNPPLRDLKNMSRQQLQNLGKFVVGRENAGHIDFGPCDLSAVPLDDICGDVVRLEKRSATVYKDGLNKPPMGKGLNLPANVYLEQSWPRNPRTKAMIAKREGKELEKHHARLKRIEGTNFVSYEADTGVWHFTVPHWSTYGLDDSDDEEFSEQEQGQSSGLSDAPQTPGSRDEETMQSIETGTGEMDDTFEFKLNQQRARSIMPGGLDDEQGVSYDYDDPSADEEMAEEEQEGRDETEQDDVFMSGAVQAPSPGTVERYHSSMMEEEEPTGDFITGAAEEEEQASPEMPGSFAAAEARVPRSILKPSNRGLGAFASPERMATDTWEEQLQRTISPRKRDRQALKDMQQSMMQAKESGEIIESPFKRSLFGQSAMRQSAFGQSYLATKSAKKAKLGGSTLALGNEDLGKSQAFRTSMDIMNSLWATEKTGKKADAGGKGFEYPYSKKARLSTSDDLNEQDTAFHDCLKPSFTANGTLIYAASGSAPQVDGALVPSMQALVGEHKDVRFATFNVKVEELVTPTLQAQKDITTIRREAGATLQAVPKATTGTDAALYGFAQAIEHKLPGDRSSAVQQELAIWQLCSVLWDPVVVSCDVYKIDVPEKLREKYATRMQLDAFRAFWSKRVEVDVDAGLRRAKTAEEKALLLLTKNDVAGACQTLITAKDFKLATLVAQLPGSKTTYDLMRKQIETWRKWKDWSEMGDAVRALYSVLAGNFCMVPGQVGAAEDRVADFCIADKFNMGWQQSLALRVNFGGHDSVAGAINEYCRDLDAEQREPHPTPYWVDSMDHPNYEDDDTLLHLLRLFASDTDAGELFDPLTVSGSSINSRLAWQLASTLIARRIVTLPDDKMAKLTLDYATELEAAGELVNCAWVLLHFKNAAARQEAVTALLQRNGDKITGPGAEGGNFEPFVNDLQLPRSMVFAAKALYAKAMDDPYAEARWLLQAAHIEEAHQVLCITVGPQAIIEQDFTILSDLVHEFPRRRPPGWDRGGQVYEAFLHLVSMSTGRKHGDEGEQALRLLKRGLRSMENGENSGTLEQRVAVIEMKKYAEDVARELGAGVEERSTSASKVSGSNHGMGSKMLVQYRMALNEVA